MPRGRLLDEQIDRPPCRCCHRDPRARLWSAGRVAGPLRDGVAPAPGCARVSTSAPPTPKDLGCAADYRHGPWPSRMAFRSSRQPSFAPHRPERAWCHRRAHRPDAAWVTAPKLTWHADGQCCRPLTASRPRRQSRRMSKFNSNRMNQTSCSGVQDVLGLTLSRLPLGESSSTQGLNGGMYWLVTRLR